MTTADRYRILALDGGGTWALIQAKALLAVYGDIPGHEVLNHFQLVAANSGGSIVLAGLIENFKLQEIVDRFMEAAWRRRLFAVLPWYDRILRLIRLGARFSTDAKYEALGKAFPLSADTPLSQIPRLIRPTQGKAPEFLVIGFNYDRERMTIFRSNRASLAGSAAPSPEATLRQAVHASSTAPIDFFDKPAEYRDPYRRFWDGATSGNNNPLLIAVTEALANGVPAESIRALSIGTGSVFLPLEDAADAPASVGSPLVKHLDEHGLFTDIKKMATCILDDPPDMATFISHVALGGRLPQPGSTVDEGPVIRMNPMVQPVLKDPAAPHGTREWKLPGWDAAPSSDRLNLDEFAELTTMDIAVVEQQGVSVINKFCDEWTRDIVVNQAIRARGDTLTCEIGQSSFQRARTLWLNCGR